MDDDASSLTEYLRNAGWSGLRRARLRRRIYALAERLSEAAIARHGAAGALAHAERRDKACAARSRGLRWTIWRRIVKDLARARRGDAP